MGFHLHQRCSVRPGTQGTSGLTALSGTVTGQGVRGVVQCNACWSGLCKGRLMTWTWAPSSVLATFCTLTAESFHLVLALVLQQQTLILPVNPGTPKRGWLAQGPQESLVGKREQIQSQGFHQEGSFRVQLQYLPKECPGNVGHKTSDLRCHGVCKRQRGTKCSLQQRFHREGRGSFWGFADPAG